MPAAMRAVMASGTPGCSLSSMAVQPSSMSISSGSLPAPEVTPGRADNLIARFGRYQLPLDSAPPSKAEVATFNDIQKRICEGASVQYATCGGEWTWDSTVFALCREALRLWLPKKQYVVFTHLTFRGDDLLRILSKVSDCAWKAILFFLY